ncbi:hypothetical protein B296_00049328 [Ensete ventricosum]|uniref:Uncharacterized protein n=1 Tax=Ensete ventricosum TaxID=4639 RepID=A0A426YBX3_ENSVE|nr:hypothetical protein B296_00049328 [Ensete ventricosum]
MKVGAAYERGAATCMLFACKGGWPWPGPLQGQPLGRAVGPPRASDACRRGCRLWIGQLFHLRPSRKGRLPIVRLQGQPPTACRSSARARRHRRPQGLPARGNSALPRWCSKGKG